MYIDNLARLSGETAQDLTNVTQYGGTFSTNAVDVSRLMRDMGEGKDLYLAVTPSVSFTSSNITAMVDFRILASPKPLGTANVVTFDFTVANATDVCTRNAHGMVNGQAVVISSSAQADLARPLAIGRTYFVVAAATNTFKLAETPGGSAIDLTTDGTLNTLTTISGTSLAFTVPTVPVGGSVTTLTSTAHGLPTGQRVTVSSATTLATGLVATKNYYIINPTTDTFSLSETPNGAAVAISSQGTDAQNLIWYPTTIGSSGPVHIGRLVGDATKPLHNSAIYVRFNPTVVSPNHPAQRYLFAQYLPTQTLTAGSVYSDIVESIQDGRRFYTSGFTVA